MFTKQKILPSAERIRALCPLDDKLNKLKLQFDEQLKNNFVKHNKLTVICGPCSADSSAPMQEYLRRLGNEQKNFENLLIVARIYTTKPHSNGQGYQGTCFHESIFDCVDLEQGIIRARRIMIDCLKTGLSVADELLYPELYPYFCDLVSYWFIGARSSEDALHRAFASGLDVCCGIKNGTDGDILKAIDSVYAVANPCVFPFDGCQIVTNGSKYSHLVLRGGKLGDKFVPNLFTENTKFAKDYLKRLGLNDFVMVDLSHANSSKIALNQIDNAKLVAANTDVNGVMMESYIDCGTDDNAYGVSKTDDCLSICDTLTAFRILNEGFSNRK